MATVPVTAQLVGHAFVSQYYNVLHQWPHMVYRFYTDASSLTRAEAGPDAAVVCARSQVEIHNTVMSMGYEECKAEIVTVDSSESMGRSVLVLVTGVMHMHRTNDRRKFVQSFLLAPQERGYYVLNDILRYLDEDCQQGHKMANGSIDMLERLQIGSAETDGNARNVSLAGIAKEGASDVPVQEYADHGHTNLVKAEQARVEDRVPYQTLEAMSNEMRGPTEPLSTGEESYPFEDGLVDKKSYASILRFQRNGSTGGAQQVSVSHQPSNEQPSFSYQRNSIGLLTNPPALPATADDTAISNNEPGEVKFIYIKNLPANVTVSQLEDDLVKVGCSRPISVILKNYKDGGVYAFVDFDDSASALNAIEASPVMIGGRRAHIEERRSTYTGGRGRSRAISRGTSSSVGARGRGPYNAGSAARGTGVHGEGDSSSHGYGVRPIRGGYGGSNARA